MKFQNAKYNGHCPTIYYYYNYYYKERNIYKVTIYINRAANITRENKSREVRQDG